ncbi:MAG: phosphoglucosamine mutase [Thermoproteota archaeon]
MISESIFRAYDIRGVYGKTLTEEIAQRIGRAFASYLEGEGKTVIMGKDVRESSKPIGEAFMTGMLQGGLNVEDIGVVTTPLLYFSSAHYKRDGGVMVTASHNPPNWNGFKILGEDGFVSQGMGMEELKELTVKGEFPESEKGRFKDKPEAKFDYQNYVADQVNIERELKVVADPGNGACSVLTPELFNKVGINVYPIYAEPDGKFSDHPPEPTDETLSYLSSLVINKEADFGVAFDGDGDRALFIDDKGKRLKGNSVLNILTKYYLQKQPHTAVVYEVSCSMSIKETIEAYHGTPVLSRVGHAYMFDKMSKQNAVLGGETSGHYYFQDVYGFDDAFYASLKMAEILSQTEEKLSQMVDSLPDYPRIPSRNYPCPDEEKFRVVEEISEDFKNTGYETVTIDGVKIMDERGWFLIRPSNTQPVIRVTVEAKDQEKLQELADLAEKKIKEKTEK